MADSIQDLLKNPGSLGKYVMGSWQNGESVFSQIVARHEKYLRQWQNNPDWLKSVKSGRSKARLNRMFSASEHLLNYVLSRPGKPDVYVGCDVEGENAKEAEQDAKRFESDVQEYLMQYQAQRKMKRKIKRGFRNLFTSRLFVLKVGMDFETGEFLLKNINVGDIRFSTTASDESEANIVIERVCEPLSKMAARFKGRKTPSGEDCVEYLRKNAGGFFRKDPALDDRETTYFEAWVTIGDQDFVAHVYKNEAFYLEQNPYWDWNGAILKPGTIEKVKTVGGRRRRSILGEGRADPKEIYGEDGKIRDGFERIYFNHFERPRKPYIISTIFDNEQSPAGATDFYEQAQPLQEDADDRKRQLADNARFMTGIWKIDSERTKLKKSDAAKIQAEAEGFIVAPHAVTGIVRDTGVPLPAHVLEDLKHSLEGIHELFGTTDTFRGERGGQETAEGRAILREQSLGRMTEIIETVDYIYGEIYNWHIQLLKLTSVRERLAKVVGTNGAIRTLKFLRDDFGEIVLRIRPGQTIPEDRISRSLRAKEAVKNPGIDPVTYFRETGWDNPEEVAKDFLRYKADPYGFLGIEPPAPPAAPDGGEGNQARAGQLAQVKQILQSPEFLNAPPEEKKKILAELQQKFPELDFEGIA